MGLGCGLGVRVAISFMGSHWLLWWASAGAFSLEFVTGCCGRRGDVGCNNDRHYNNSSRGFTWTIPSLSAPNIAVLTSILGFRLASSVVSHINPSPTAPGHEQCGFTPKTSLAVPKRFIIASRCGTSRDGALCPGLCVQWFHLVARNVNNQQIVR